jgi:hypothetical protein
LISSSPAEERAGASWYKLTHDRLIEPLRASNERYAGQWQHRFVRWAVAVALTAVIAAVVTPLLVLSGKTDWRVEPDELSFGQVRVNATGLKSVVVKAGSTPFEITGLIFKPDQLGYVPGSVPCLAIPLGPKKKCEITVKFQPRNPGEKTAVLSILRADGRMLTIRRCQDR